jgi:hypothetical protein
VMLMGIGEAQVVQGSLLHEHGAGQRSAGLMKAMDALESGLRAQYRIGFFLTGSQVLGHCAGKPCRAATPRDGAMCRSRIPVDN